jgi:hypothetical protein
MTALRMLFAVWGGYLVAFVIVLYLVDLLFRFLKGEDK